MKKLICLIALILSTAVFAEEAAKLAPVETAQPQQEDANTTPKNQSIAISDNVKIVAKTDHEESKEQYYSIDFSYPELQGDNLTTNEKQFNQLVSELAHREVDQFKKYVASDMPHMQTLPDELKQNKLLMDYDVDVIKPPKSTILSVRLKIEGMQAGRAHPYHTHQVLNFDITRGKTLTLNELFKPHSKYLNLIAKYSEEKLNEKLKDKWMISDGTKPDPKNYKNWNLQPGGLLITFDEYQVAPYVYGAQEILIPYAELKSLLSQKSLIYPCAQKINACEFKSKVMPEKNEKVELENHI